MNFDAVNRVTFNCEWFKEEAMVIKSFLLIYYPVEKSGELYDVESQKKFLRKTRLNLNRDDFFIGSKLDIFGRQVEIVGFADVFTKKLLGKSRQRVFVLIKAFLMKNLGNVFKAFEKSGFSFTNALMAQFSEQSATHLFGERARGNPEITALVNEMTSDPVIGIEMFADDGFEKLKKSFRSGFENSGIENQAEGTAPPHLEYLFREEANRKGIYFSKTEEDSNEELKIFFSAETNDLNTAVLHDSILGIIRPHIVKEGRIGDCLNDIISNGFKISALKIMVVDRVNCEEFFEIYRGVCHEYMQMVSELASGPCLALEIQKTSNQMEIHTEFRKFCGPKDPDIAKQLRPNTLRAKYGKNKVLNAIHVTDLPDDVVLELQYVFKLL